MNIIQIIYKINPTSLNKECMYTCECIPDCNYILIKDDEVDELLCKYCPDVWEAFSNIMRVDLAKYISLLHFGGLYIDNDIMLGHRRTELTRMFNRDTFFYEHPDMDTLGTTNTHIDVVCNSVMYCEKGSKFLNYLHKKINNTLYKPLKHKGLDVVYTTGPGMLTRELARYRLVHLDEVNIYSHTYFEKENLQQRREHADKQIKDIPEESIGVHYSLVSWI